MVENGRKWKIVKPKDASKTEDYRLVRSTPYVDRPGTDHSCFA